MNIKVNDGPELLLQNSIVARFSNLTDGKSCFHLEAEEESELLGLMAKLSQGQALMAPFPSLLEIAFCYSSAQITVADGSELSTVCSIMNCIREAVWDWGYGKDFGFAVLNVVFVEVRGETINATTPSKRNIEWAKCLDGSFVDICSETHLWDPYSEEWIFAQ